MRLGDARGGGAWLRPKITSKPLGLDLANETCRGSDLGSRDLVGVGNTRFQVVGVSGKLQDGGGGLVVLTFVPYPHPFSLFFFSAHQPPPSSHPHPMILPDVLGTCCMRSRWVVVEE